MDRWTQEVDGSTQYVVWLIGIYALVFGVLLVGLALRLRSQSQEGIGSRGPGAALSG